MVFFDKLRQKAKTPPKSEHAQFVPGVGRMPYPAYRGKEPYLFVSYAHMDSERVFAEIKRFNEAGFFVWYDEGIAPGNEWTEEIAVALANCSLFVVMITPNSIPRINVQNEINFALRKNKPFLAIHLEESELPPGMELQIGTKQAILKYNMTEEEYNFKYIEAFTRLGLNRHEDTTRTCKNQAAVLPVQTVLTTEPSSKPAEIFDDSPEDAKKRANGDLVRVDGFDIEHGFLKGYYGQEKNIKLPNAAVILGYGSFGKSRSFIESVDLNKVNCLLNGALSNCPNLHTVIVPENMNTIEENAFSSSPNLVLYVRKEQLPEGFEEKFRGKKIVYLDEAESYAVEPTANFEMIGSTIRAYHGSNKCFTVPKHTKKIMSYAFSKHNEIENVTLSERVEFLDASVFDNCPNLERIVIEGQNVQFAAVSPVTGCPKTTVYCQRSSATYDNLKRCYTGLIRFIGEDSVSAPMAASKVASSEKSSDGIQQNTEKNTNEGHIKDDVFQISHGFLRAYSGTERNIRLPNNVVILDQNSFGESQRYIESVDLNNTTALFKGAFENCPNLHTVRIPHMVTTFNKDAFIGCPNLVLYVRSFQKFPDGFEDNFCGKKIVYLDEISTSPAPATPSSTTIVSASTEAVKEPALQTIPSPASDVRIPLTEGNGNSEETCDLELKEHSWGNFVPKGTAEITLSDGTKIEAIANSLLCYTAKMEKNFYTTPRLYAGLDNYHDDYNYHLEDMILFADMQSIKRQGDILLITDYDEETTEIRLVEDMTFWCLDGGSKNKYNSITVFEIDEVIFNRMETPDFSIGICKITMQDGVFTVPSAYLNFLIDFKNSPFPNMKITTDLVPLSGYPLNLKRIRTFSVVKIIKAAEMYSPETEAEIEVNLKNEEIYKFTFKRRISIYALAGNGILRCFGIEKLKSIELL